MIMTTIAISMDIAALTALTTKGLEEKKASKLINLSISGSVLIKGFFIFVSAFMFRLSFESLRVPSGIAIAFITYTMLMQNGRMYKHIVRFTDNILIANTAAFIGCLCLGMDKIDTLISIGTRHSFGTPEYLLLLSALFVSVPAVIMITKHLRAVMERNTVFSYIISAYVMYSAVSLILSDQILSLFLAHIKFDKAYLLSFSAAILVAAYVFFMVHHKRKKTRTELLPSDSYIWVNLCIAAYAVINIGIISYLSTMPTIDGESLSVMAVYGFDPSGSNAIYLNRVYTDLLKMAILVYVSEAAFDTPFKPFIEKFSFALNRVVQLLLLTTMVSFGGLTMGFGLGETPITTFLGGMLFQAIILATYAAAYVTISSFAKTKRSAICLGMGLTVGEALIRLFTKSSGTVSAFRMAIPDNFIETFPMLSHNIFFLIAGILISIVYILISFGIYSKHKKNSAEKE
jgi:predicted tellurium resistance membrane protein TerC